MRLIDADALDWWYKWRPIRRVIDDAPTVDAVPVVRCRECKYSAPNGIYGCTCYHFKQYETHGMGANDFCSYGERKGGNE